MQWATIESSPLSDPGKIGRKLHALSV